TRRTTFPLYFARSTSLSSIPLSVKSSGPDTFLSPVLSSAETAPATRPATRTASNPFITDPPRCDERHSRERDYGDKRRFTEPAVRKVVVRFDRRDLLDGALDPHLPFEGVPEEDDRGERVRVELAALPAVVVRKEGEAAVVEGLQQDGPRRGPAVGRGRGQGH